ncbi:SDR family oxidoreductase [Photobacterium sanguinicancri]|uniref:SDR family oxidoreductase n=1 Tax=Photobacterium sanguinicancri TaxID=875932 RepID=UPI00248125B4|nr:SDR family oxidoreductase [Photobacterium sanguinicancri]
MIHKVFLVTGGARGIGKSICDLLSRHDAVVFALDIDEESGFKLVANNPLIRFRQADVTNQAEIQCVIDEIQSQYGRLDGLVNNAAISNPYNAPLAELNLHDWKRTIEINLTAPLMMTQAALSLLNLTQGAVVNIASTRAVQAEANTEAYSASKGGLVALTKALAVSLGPHVRVNCISPGWIHTNEDEVLRPIDHKQHLTGQVGHVIDIANMAEFLLSSKASFITGENFTIDGGMTKKMIYAE